MLALKDHSVRVMPDPAEFARAATGLVARGEQVYVAVGDVVHLVSGRTAVALVALLAATGPGDQDSIAVVPDVLTTGQAAELLGVSRPTVVALVDRGEIPASRVGSRRRLRAADVLAYRDRRRIVRSAALDEIAALSDELGLYE